MRHTASKTDYFAAVVTAATHEFDANALAKVASRQTCRVDRQGTVFETTVSNVFVKGNKEKLKKLIHYFKHVESKHLHTRVV